MGWDYAGSLITEEECCAACEGLVLDGNARLADLDAAHFYVVRVEVLFCLFCVTKPVEFYLFEGSVITKSIEFLHCFHFLSVLGFIGYIDDLF
jgi:hypothetical protein